MAITQGSFQNIPSSRPNQPHQPVPDKLVPAQEWAVAYFFSYEVDATEMVTGGDLNSTLVLRVYNSANVVKYVITIKERYFYVVINPGGGMFYSWQWVPQVEKIEGRKGTAPDSPLMKTLGQGTLGVENPQQGGYGIDSFPIQSRYFSGIFQEPLERGDSFEVYRHTVDTSSLVKEARLQIATELGGGVSTALHDPRVGTVWHVAPHNEKEFRIADTRRTSTFTRQDTSLVTGRTPIFTKLLRRGATLFLVVLYSFGDGLTLDVQTSIDAGATWETNAMLLDDFRVLAAQLSLDGSTLWLYGLARSTAQNAPPTPVPSRAVLKRGEDGWKASDKATITYLDAQDALKNPDLAPPPPLPEEGVVTLEVSGGTLHLVAGGDSADPLKPNPVRIWQSTDELVSLREAKITDSEAEEDKENEKKG